MIVLVAVVFGLLSLGGLTALTLLAGLPALGLAFVAILFVAELPVPGDRRLPGWALDHRPHPPRVERHSLRPVLIGLFILGLLFAVPVLGGVLQFVVVLLGLGAIVLAVFQSRPAPGQAPETPGQAPAEVLPAVQA